MWPRSESQAWSQDLFLPRVCVSGYTAECFKGNLDAGLERFRQRGQGGPAFESGVKSTPSQSPGEESACGAGRHGRQRGHRSLSEGTPLSESLRMFLKLKYSPTAPPGPCWSYSHGAGAQERASARCTWQGLPKEAVCPPAALVVLPGFPGTHSPPSIWMAVGQCKKKYTISTQKNTPCFF